MKVTKAEILLTRRCNIKCSTCDVIRPAFDMYGNPTVSAGEMTVEEWKLAFDIIYQQLGAGFIAIYGGEPLEYGLANVGALVRHLASYRTEERGFTIISNAIGLTPAKMQYLADCGLDSWTSSVDVVRGVGMRDRYMAAKTQAGWKALTYFREELGLRDTCGIVTLTRDNLPYVLDTIKVLSDEGHWVGIDFLHYQRGDGEYSFSAPLDMMKVGGLTMEHADKLGEIAEFLKQNRATHRVFPTDAVLDMWKEPDAVKLRWKCKPGHALTVDYNGTIGLCDDRMPTSMGSARKRLLPKMDGTPWHVHDFANPSGAIALRSGEIKSVWDAFMDWSACDLERCQGCFWSTHKMAVDIMDATGSEASNLKRQYVHRD